MFPGTIILYLASNILSSTFSNHNKFGRVNFSFLSLCKRLQPKKSGNLEHSIVDLD